MKTFIIATEAGIKIEVKENLKKDQVNKLEDNFSEVKDFVEDKGGGIIVITAQQNHIVLDMMLQQAKSLEMIIGASSNMKCLMEDTIKFIDSLSNKFKKENNTDDEISGYLDDAFEALHKRFPERAILIMAVDPNEKCFSACGNLNMKAALMLLLSEYLDKIRAAHEDSC